MKSPGEKTAAAATLWSRIAPDQRSASLRYYHRQAQENRRHGLTVKGKARQRRPWAKTATERRKMALDRSRTAAVRRILVNRFNGLTTRGTKRIIPVCRGDAWLLQGHIDKLAAAIAACFDDLSPAARTRVLELEKALSTIRRAIA